MGLEKLKVSTNPPTFVEKDSSGRVSGVAIARTLEEAEGTLDRGDAVLAAWLRAARRGEPIGAVIFDPQITTAEEAVKNPVKLPPKP